MNLFQIIFFDVVLLTFPILVYLIYLTTDSNITKESKKLYFSLTLLTSFFMLLNYGVDTKSLVSILVISSLVTLSFLEDKYVLANMFMISNLIIHNKFNNVFILIISYALIDIIYILKRKTKFNNPLFIQISVILNSLVYIFWIYKFNNNYYDLSNIFQIIICYAFITNILCLMYETGKSILTTQLTFKELSKEKQIRLSLFKITHEIKNPIAVCKGYLDMLNVKDERQVERYIPIIKSEIERLLSLLQDFLLINKSNLDLDVMDINMLLEDTLDKLKPLLDDNKIYLSTNIIDDEIFINGDYNRLSQVMLNIIKNSIEAIPKEKKGNIKISSKVNKDKYKIVIEDNGEGMTKETLSKMKEPFFTTKKRGSGLGTSLIYEIVEAHHGKIEYESEYGKGTKVKLEFPLYNSVLF